MYKQTCDAVGAEQLTVLVAWERALERAERRGDSIAATHVHDDLEQLDGDQTRFKQRNCFRKTKQIYLAVIFRARNFGPSTRIRFRIRFSIQPVPDNRSQYLQPN